MVPNLQLWICSGEALRQELAKDFLTACPGRVLINLYGSTEIAGDVTCWVQHPSFNNTLEF